MRTLLVALLLLPATLPGAHAADAVTIYRCTAEDGSVALRDSRCPDGQDQQALDMLRPVDPPPRPASPMSAREPVPAQVIETRVVHVPAPRPMYQCTTPDGDTYTADNDEGNPRWVPLWTLGVPAYWPRNPLGDRVGAPRPAPPSAGPGAPDYPALAGVAYLPGTWVRDHCARLPEARTCDVLREQQRELRKEWFNAMPGRRAEVTAEERVLAARLASSCRG